MTHSQKAINEIIRQSGKTQAEIAKSIGVPRQRINEWLSGKVKPRFETVIILCLKNNLKIIDIMLVL